MKQKTPALLICILSLLMISGTVFGQSVERTPDRTAVVSEPVAKMSGVVYWWKLMGEWNNGGGEPTYLDLRNVVYEGNTYLMLTRTKTESAYRYPKAELERYSYPAYTYYFLDKKKLESVISATPEFNKSYGVDLEIAHSRKADSTPTRLNEIADDIWRMFAMEKYQKEYHGKVEPPQSLMISVFPVIHEGKKKVRYRFVEGLNAKPIFKASDFEFSYFEVDFDTFYKFTHYDEAPAKAEDMKKP